MKARYPIQDYNQRLHKGVILWKGVPHCIHSEVGQLDITDLVTGEMVAQQVAPDHEDLDIASFELGYINTPVGAVYLTRMPLRQFKQAITPGSVIEYRLTNDGPSRTGRGRSEWLLSKEFRNRYTKKFPRFDEAVQILNNLDRVSIALSPDIAISRLRSGKMKVWHKLELVGTIDAGSRTVKVPTSEKAWVISMYLGELDWEVD